MISKQWRYRSLAVLVGLSPFLLLEWGLRLYDPGSEKATMDPLVGFSEVHDLFELDSASKMYRTARPRQILFGTQEFAASKPKNGFRAFCLGGSTVRGRPFHVETAFPQWLKLELQAMHPTRHFETVNCGGLSYASYRLRMILAEVLDYQPDLIILAMGHNEFLEDRTYQSQKSRSAAWAWVQDRVSQLRIVALAQRQFGNSTQPDVTVLESEVSARLDTESGYASYHRDEAWRQSVLGHFALTLSDMVDMCKERDIPVLLVNLGANLRDTPPFKSEHAPHLDRGAELRWQRIFDRATEVEPDPQRALDAYREAEAVDDQYALLSYRMARCFDRLGNYDKAREYYLRAKELDVCPLRMLEEASQTIRATAETAAVPFVDAASRIGALSAEHIPGHDWYADHVHPSIMAHQEIAQAIVEALVRADIVQGSKLVQDGDRRKIARSHFQSLGSRYFANGRRRVQWLEQWARREKHFKESLPVDDRGLLHRGFRRFCFAEYDEAWRDIEQAIASNPERLHDVLEFARKLVQYGRPHAATHLLVQLDALPAAASYQDEMLLGRFIAALEREDFQEASTLYAEHKTSFQAMTASPWRRTVSDAVARGEALISP